MQSRWWSKAVLVFAVIGLAALPAGALGTRFGLWEFPTGLLLVAIGTGAAAVCLLAGLIGLVVAFARKLDADKPRLYGAVLVSLAVLGFMLPQFQQAREVPAIHNISTDVDDPPAFVAVPALRGDNANPLEYDASRLAEQQQAAYPDVRPWDTDRAPETVYADALEVLGQMGLEIVASDAAAGRIEATATTFWFGFKDDVVVRIRPTPTGGSRVDVRSVSRVGQSDLGANARRIGEFLRGLAAT